MNILIKDATIVPMTASGEQPKFFKGSIGISDDRIVMVSQEQSDALSFRANYDNVRVIDGTHKIVMPGLINTHNHSAMTVMRGYADDKELMDWLNNYIWPYEAKFTRDDVMWGAMLGAVEMLLGGTTTVVDMYSRGEAIGEAFQRAGIRGVLAANVRTEESFEQIDQIVAKYGAGQCSTISFMIAPHAPYSCSTEMLVKAKERAAELGVGIHIHLAETQSEEQLIQERYGKSPTKYIYDLGLMTPSTMLAHCVHLSEDDRELIKSSGASVAHNPQSNMKLGSGVAPVADMLARGINVSLGTDGPCSNNDLDMWDEMRSASFLQKVTTQDPLVMPAYQVLEMATVNGAKAIGRQADLGRIAVGMKADVIIIDSNKPHLCPEHDPVANLVYAAKAADVQTVIVNGDIVVDNGSVTRIALDELMQQVRKRSKK